MSKGHTPGSGTACGLPGSRPWSPVMMNRSPGRNRSNIFRKAPIEVLDGRSGRSASDPITSSPAKISPRGTFLNMPPTSSSASRPAGEREADRVNPRPPNISPTFPTPMKIWLARFKTSNIVGPVVLRQNPDGRDRTVEGAECTEDGMRDERVASPMLLSTPFLPPDSVDTADRGPHFVMSGHMTSLTSVGPDNRRTRRCDAPNSCNASSADPTVAAQDFESEYVLERGLGLRGISLRKCRALRLPRDIRQSPKSRQENRRPYS